MKTTERLLTATKDIWAAYSEHPFVLGLQNGTLDQEKFRYYIIQDFLYLEEYAKVFALGIAKAKSPETIQLFSKYVTLSPRERWIFTGAIWANSPCPARSWKAHPGHWITFLTHPIC